jgi:hypothetical protein
MIRVPEGFGKEPDMLETDKPLWEIFDQIRTQLPGITFPHLPPPKTEAFVTTVTALDQSNRPVPGVELTLVTDTVRAVQVTDVNGKAKLGPVVFSKGGPMPQVFARLNDQDVGNAPASSPSMTIRVMMPEANATMPKVKTHHVLMAVGGVAVLGLTAYLIWR